MSGIYGGFILWVRFLSPQRIEVIKIDPCLELLDAFEEVKRVLRERGFLPETEAERELARIL
jgi:hypothetical protein